MINWLTRVLLSNCRACIVSALRLQTLYPSTTTSDPTWDKIPSGFYGVIEANLGITCACVVTLRPLLHKLGLSLYRNKQQTTTCITMPEEPKHRASVYHITLPSLHSSTLGSGHNQDVKPGRASGA